jgi:hypothetical protein
VTTSLHKAGIAAAISMVLFAASAVALKGQKNEQKPFGLIFGTVYGPDDRPVYGVKIRIHPVGKKKPKWELISDHRGEFAQRVPLVPSDYEVTGEAEIAPLLNGKPQLSHKKRVKDRARVHVVKDVEQDISLHLRD